MWGGSSGSASGGKPKGLVVRHVRGFDSGLMSQVDQVANVCMQYEGRLQSFGVDFSFMEEHRKFKYRRDPDVYIPGARQLVEDCMRGFGHEPGNPMLLNIIINAYEHGLQDLHSHIDSIDLFEDKVYGLILESSHAEGLKFQRNSNKYVIQEEVGSVFYISEEARFEWKHSVAIPKVPGGKRVSITWRYVRKGFVKYSRSTPEDRNMWVENFIAAVATGPVDVQLQLATSYHRNHAYFHDKNEQFGPALPPDALAKVASKVFANRQDGSTASSSSSSNAKSPPDSGYSGCPRFKMLLDYRMAWDNSKPSPVDCRLRAAFAGESIRHANFRSEVELAFLCGIGHSAYKHQVDAVEALARHLDSVPKVSNSPCGSLVVMAPGAGKSAVIACIAALCLEAKLADLCLVRQKNQIRIFTFPIVLQNPYFKIDFANYF